MEMDPRQRKEYLKSIQPASRPWDRGALPLEARPRFGARRDDVEGDESEFRARWWPGPDPGHVKAP